MATIAELEALIAANERRLARVDSDQARAVERINRRYANDPTTMQTELAATNARFDEFRTEILGYLADQRAELTALQNQPNPTPPAPTSAQQPQPPASAAAAVAARDIDSALAPALRLDAIRAVPCRLDLY
jgi:hypothetical protein